MAEGLQTLDGQVVEVNADEVEKDFARAMAAPVTDAPAPPRKPAASPTATEKPKRRGRPPKSEQARVTAAPPTDQKSEKDYTEDITGLTQGVWLATASIPWTQAYAAVVKANQGPLVGALNAGAQQNAKVRAAVEKWSNGGAGLWAVNLAVVGANMGIQALTLMRDPELRKQATESTRTELKSFLKAQGIEIPEDEKPGNGSPSPEG